MKTVLFVGAGRHQRRAILQARERGLRVVAVDRNPEAPGLQVADVGEAVDFTDIDAVTEVARRHRVDGVLTVSADRAVPVVAAVTERLGLPSIGTEVAHRMRNKIVMRRSLGEEGVPQPPFAAVRSLTEGRRALRSVPLPAVLKPADSGGQRGVFRIDTSDDLDAHLHAALSESVAGECILEGYVEGTDMNGIVVARDGTAAVVTLSDRLRPAGIGFGVGWIHVYPASAFADQLALSERVAARAVEVLGLRDGIAFPQLIAHPDGSVAVVEVAARIPGGQMADLVWHATGVDLVEVALRLALGEPVPDEVALPRFSQPLAIRFLTAQPGSLPTGLVTRVGSLAPVLAAEGVVQADTYLQVGETIRPVRLDGDRRGYVIATADTSVEALDRAEAAARLLTVEVEA
ncbi:MAG: ATP-grasp domain-containing protein [Gaiellaceae bacterium]